MLFAPDIQHRYQQLSLNNSNNQQVLDTLYNALQERAFLEHNYAISLDVIQKTLDLNENELINEDIVDIVQSYRSVVLCEKQQSEYLRDSIKNDLLVAMKELQNRSNDTMKAIDINTRDLDKRLKQIMHNLNQRSKRYQQVITDIQHVKNDQIKLQLESDKSTSQVLLIQSINDYNKLIDEYFEGCAIQHQTYRSIEKDRREVFKDTNMKLQVFHVSIVKNIEYNLKKLNQKIEIFDPQKAIYQYKQDQEKPMLNKYNVNNYLEQMEIDINVKNSSINLKGMQASVQIQQIWSKLKRQINQDGSYDQMLMQMMTQNKKIEESLYKKIASSEEELDQFLQSFQRLELSVEAQNHLIPLNQSLQNIHRLIVDLIQYLYQRSQTEFTLRVIKSALIKYDSLPVSEQLRDQVVIYRDNISKSPCLFDHYFCLRHFTIKLHEQNIDQTQNDRNVLMAEIKFQITKLLQHQIGKDVITQAISKLGLNEMEIKQIVSFLDQCDQ